MTTSAILVVQYLATIVLKSVFSQIYTVSLVEPVSRNCSVTARKNDYASR